MTTVAEHVDRAVTELLARPADALYAIAQSKNVPFYPEDDVSSWVTIDDVYTDARALRKALERREAVAKRSAIVLLISAEPTSAWPIVKPFVQGAAPKKSKGLGVVSETTRGMVVVIPNIPDEDFVALYADPEASAASLTEAALYHRTSKGARLRLLERTLAVKMTDATWRLGESLCEALGKVARDELSALLRAARLGWEKWAADRLVALGDKAALEEVAKGLDAKNPQPAINAAIALGPSRWPELERRFFTKEALSSKKGRTRAASILHGVLTAILADKATAWKRATAFVALVDSLADEKGDALAFGAASLAAVLQGKKPLMRR